MLGHALGGAVRRALAFLLALLVAAPSFGASVSGGSIAGGSVGSVNAAPAEYYTFVVFGDTQYQSRDCAISSATGRCPEFDASLDWIRDNAAAENIVAVAFVGDLINAGTPLPFTSTCDAPDPPTARSLGDCSPFASEGTCGSAFSGDGCGWTTTATPPCAPCTLVDDADAEWTAFNTRAARIATGDISLPMMMAQGNHDNDGAANGSFPLREPQGWNDYYSATYWESIDNGTTYDYLSAETYVDADGNGHAWTITVGTQDFLVVAPPMPAGGGGISSAAMAWAEGVMSDYSTLPAILLAHWISDGDVEATIDTSSISAPNLIWAAGGHVDNGGSVGTTTNGAETVVETVSDFTNNSPLDTLGNPQNDWLTLFRWYPATNEAEVVNFSPASGLNSASLNLAKQSFDIMPPILGDGALYDLSPHADRINLAFGDDTNGGNLPPAWAIQPSASTVCAATNASELSACLNLADRRITVAAGTYVGPFTLDEDDTWLDMDNGAVLSGDFTVASNTQRVKISGGHIRDGSVRITGPYNDVTIDNVNILNNQANPYTTALCFGSVGPCQRLTVINSTIRSSRWTMLFDNTGSLTTNDVIIANVDAWSDHVEGALNDESVLRLMEVERVIVADSHFRTSPTAKHVVRMHYGTDHVLLVNTIIDKASGGVSNIWLDTDSGTGELNDLNSIYIVENDLYQVQTTAQTEVQIDDSAAGGPGVWAYIHDNESFVPTAQSDLNFLIGQGGSGSDITVDAGGNTSTAWDSGFLPFTAGADH